jgi:hypothetical protein
MDSFSEHQDLDDHRVLLDPVREDGEVEDFRDDIEPVIEDDRPRALYSFGWLFPEVLIQLGQQELRVSTAPSHTHSPYMDMPGAWRD